MKPYLKAEEITREIKEKLPVIDEETFREHYCSECLYYAERIDKKPRCMQRQCSWDQEEEHFAPVLRRMIPILDEECMQADSHGTQKKDPCYKCAYNCHALCIGFCYQQMTAHPVDPNEKI